MDVDVRNPRLLQAAGAAVVLAGFAADIRVVVPIVAVGLLVAYVLLPGLLRPYRVGWITEVVLLAVAGLLLPAGRAGWSWVLALLAAGIAAMAAIADVWIAPAVEPGSPER